jgi:hypothetical protein
MLEGLPLAASDRFQRLLVVLRLVRHLVNIGLKAFRLVLVPACRLIVRLTEGTRAWFHARTECHPDGFGQDALRVVARCVGRGQERLNRRVATCGEASFKI